MSKPIQWRAPADVRAWLEAQPDGMSAALERLVRAAMEGRPTPREIVLEAKLEQALALLEKAMKERAPATPTEAKMDAPANSKWSGWDDE